MHGRNQRGPILATGAATTNGFSLVCGSAERCPTSEIFASTLW